LAQLNLPPERQWNRSIEVAGRREYNDGWVEKPGVEPAAVGRSSQMNPRHHFMRNLPLQLLAVLAWLATGAAASAVGEADNFYALFYDGSRACLPAQAKDVWGSSEAMLGGRRLFGTKNPVRLLQNLRPRVAQEGPRVLMANGDVIPGRITGFLPASAANDAPARLLISLDAPLLPAAARSLPVRAESVLRVATSTDATGSGQPGLLVLANGTRLQARAMRWTEQGLSALTASGFTAVAFDAIADFSVPKVDVVRAVLDDSSYPPFGPDTVVGRLETFEGAVLTYACEMTLAGVGRAPASASYLLIQPNWSTSVVLVPVDSIWRQSFRAAKEVPLSLLPAKTLREEVGLHRWSWRRNANVDGDELASGGVVVDQGVGTHSCCEIAFELPSQAKAFTTLVGLDRCIGPGACATYKIYSEQAAGKPLFSSGLLRSGQEPTPVGPLSIAGCRSLVLATAWAGDGRPPDAYPLDIGGHVDWLMPLVTVEADAAAYGEALRRFVPGWEAWDLAPADSRRVRAGPYWDTPRNRWLPLIQSASNQPLTIHRKSFPVSSANGLLELSFAYFKDAPVPTVELRVDNVRVMPDKWQAGDNQGNPGGRSEALARRRGVSVQGRDSRTGHKGALMEITQQYRMRFMHWNLQQYNGRTVQLTLSVTLDNQLKGLVWHELAAKPLRTEP
jgi:hypothetical protein